MAAVALAGGWSPVEAQTATRLEGQATAKQAPQTRRVSRPSGDVRKPRFRVDDETGALVPDLRAEAAIIYDVQTGEIIWGENIEVQRSIASITKVMTAVVFLDWNPDLSQDVLVTRADVRNASTTYLLPGERVQVYDLLHLLLIPSDNAAARVIARMYPGGEPAFVDRMNQKAEQLGLQSTTYADPSGLSSANVSSAYDMARLITYAVSNERIGSIMRTSQYTLRTSRRREVTVRTTNQLVRQGDVDVVGGKTGFIRKAGYCLAALLRLPEGGPEVAVVVLGAQTSLTRFWEARHLLNWFSQNAKSLFAGVPDAHSE
jgi:D-alanyl-D-alanine endopeptidase (penicillin-binding protein 7)